MPPVSKIAKMPEDMREWLRKALVERAYGDIKAITQELNDRLREAGVGLDVGKSAVGLEAQRVRRAQETIKAATEHARILADTSRDDANLRGEATMALAETEMFENMLALREAEATTDPAERMVLMSKVAKNLATLSRARINQARHRLELEAKVKAAADKVAKLAKAAGLDAKTAAEIRRSILGIKDKPKGQDAQAAQA